ncbi:MAG: ADP-ribosylglycohydrolase family protein [Nocardioidaceae bacterium]
MTQALESDPRRFTPNGFTVTALQAAAAAIVRTPTPGLAPAQSSYHCLHLQDALHEAIRVGHDTDTVAAIAGGLLGARWGASAVPARWSRQVHGWPGLRARDLTSMAARTINGGSSDRAG